MKIFSLISVAIFCLSIPQIFSAPPQPTPKIDITAELNAALQLILSQLGDPFFYNGTLTIPLKMTGIIDANIIIKTVYVTGMTQIGAHDCTRDENLDDTFDVDLAFNAPTIEINSDSFNLTGLLVDDIELYGEGPGRVLLEDIWVIINGTATHFGISDLKPEIYFKDLKVGLNLKKLTVALEGIMPGTDFGALINEFLSMIGPEIFDIIEQYLNTDGNEILLKFINGIFPPENSTI